VSICIFINTNTFCTCTPFSHLTNI
jgi:hypothetical protein